MKRTSDVKLIGPYRSAVRISLILQVFLCVITAAVMDHGILFSAAILALLPYWIATFWITSRRPENPSKMDLFFIKYGYFGIFLCTYALSF